MCWCSVFSALAGLGWIGLRTTNKTGSKSEVLSNATISIYQRLILIHECAGEFGKLNGRIFD